MEVQAMSEDDRENVIQQGIDAWHQLKKSWEHWRMVGKALLVGREWAMHHAGTNRPEGKGYNQAFGGWLERYKLNDIDQGDRHRLLEVMDNLDKIEGWRAGLTEGERRKLNNPSTVLRKWRKATAVPAEEKPKKDTLSESVRKLDTRVYDLTTEKDELQTAYDKLKSDYDQLNKRAKWLEEQCQSKQDRIDKLEEQANQREKDVKQLEKITSQYMDKNAALLKELEKLKIDKDALAQWEATSRRA
jgi:DNA repair exonuclease SbcCD ATPase subunit